MIGVSRNRINNKWSNNLQSKMVVIISLYTSDTLIRGDGSPVHCHWYNYVFSTDSNGDEERRSWSGIHKSWKNENCKFFLTVNEIQMF